MIILTGASGGIGGAVLPSLTALDSVIAIYNTKPPNLSGIDGVTPYQLDLTSDEKVSNFASEIKGSVQNITLIHAAAVSNDSLAVKFTTQNWNQIIDVNLRGNFLLTRAMLIPMMEQRWGRVIHLSSVAGIRGTPGTIAYATSKTGLLGLSRVLANEYARFGITSNVLVPGIFQYGTDRNT